MIANVYFVLRIHAGSATDKTVVFKEGTVDKMDGHARFALYEPGFLAAPFDKEIKVDVAGSTGTDTRPTVASLLAGARLAMFREMPKQYVVEDTTLLPDYTGGVPADYWDPETMTWKKEPIGGGGSRYSAAFRVRKKLAPDEADADATPVKADLAVGSQKLMLDLLLVIQGVAS